MSKFSLNLNLLAFVLLYHISACLIILVLTPVYILPFPLLHFRCFLLTFRSVWCHNFRWPVCCRTNTTDNQSHLYSVCVVTRQAVLVWAWGRFTELVNMCCGGEKSLQTPLECTQLRVRHIFCACVKFTLPLWACFNFQQSLFIMLCIASWAEWMWSVSSLCVILSVIINHRVWLWLFFQKCQSTW